MSQLKQTYAAMQERARRVVEMQSAGMHSLGTQETFKATVQPVKLTMGCVDTGCTYKVNLY